MIRIQGIPIVAARLAAAAPSTKLVENSRRNDRPPFTMKTLGKVAVQQTNTPVAA